MITEHNQLELSLCGNGSAHHFSSRNYRKERAHWWFQRMRKLVEATLEWQPAPAGRPEQLMMHDNRLR